MREGGLTRLVTQDGFVLERPAPSPLEQAHLAALASRRPEAERDDADPADELDAEERAEHDLRERWDAHWSRVTRSSGADIPNFPGAEQAARFLGVHA